MKTITNTRKVAVGSVACLMAGWASCQDLNPPCWRAFTNTTYQKWEFNTSALTPAPDSVTNSFGTPQCSVSVGTASEGYIPTVSGSTNVGFWNVMQDGLIQLTIPNKAGSPPASFKLVWVQLLQYIGGPVSAATVVVPGATLVGSSSQIVEVFGARNNTITLSQSLWRLESSPASETVRISGAAGGSIIDDVIVDTWAVPTSIAYVDDSYGSPASCAAVGWPQGGTPADKIFGYTAFSTIQNGVTNAPTGGSVFVASGSYSGNVFLTKNLTLTLGPTSAAVSLAGNLSLTSSSTLSLNADNPSPGSFDQIAVAGTVSLGGANLSVAGLAGFSIGQSVTIIDNDGTDAVVGTFNGLAQGAVVSAGPVQFTISYTGGTGNDVVLTAWNRAPITTPNIAGVVEGQSVTIGFAKLTRDDTDPDGDTFGITGVGAAANGTAAISGSSIVYTAPMGFSGQTWFDYIVTDDHGAFSPGRVNVTVTPANAQTLNMVSIVAIDGGTSYAVTAAGVPNYIYIFERGASVTGPWTEVGSASAGSEGRATITDSSPLTGGGFYRAKYQLSP